jgi:hypothetical protein
MSPYAFPSIYSSIVHIVVAPVDDVVVVAAATIDDVALAVVL